ncbi:hypothetical protein D0X99_17945 [Algoriphagus lacus]|uniref:Bifunctional metallophosphatase/5'-nucleotidase n=1 Tax=Algoriphagus lacus TaxID=2056311 RepID=A0A418PMN4_9BACT|nr:hypothetical protein [Algoriphagus lacus]RIW12976.1 hypothetical protein D0X99_17945 [Algoriphagus lacus]
MKKKTRREFLRSSSIVASLAAFSSSKLFNDKTILYLKTNTSDTKISLIHSGGLNGARHNPDQLGGLEAIQAQLLSSPSSRIFLDSGNLINPDQSIGDNLEFLNQMVKSGLNIATLGMNESNLPTKDLAYLVENSGLKILGNSLEKQGLVLGKTYFSRAVVQWGKYKIGVLPTRNATLSDINRRGLELKLLFQCDLVIGLGPLPQEGNLTLLQRRHHEVYHYFVDANDQLPVGTHVFKSTKGIEFWMSKPGNQGKYLGAFEYTLNSAYQLRHFANLSFMPGEASWNKKMAFLAQSSQLSNPQS